MRRPEARSIRFSGGGACRRQAVKAKLVSPVCKDIKILHATVRESFPNGRSLF